MDHLEHTPPPPSERSRLLTRAITRWEQDKPIPMTLAVELMEFGYDVKRLEQEYHRG